MSSAATRLRRNTDPTTLISVMAAFILLIAAILFGGNPKAFFDFPSVLIVICGTFAVTIACFSFGEVWRSQGVVFKAMLYRPEDLSQTAMRSVELAEIARMKGILELDKYRNLTRHNAFLRRGIDMVVDAIPLDEIEKVLHYEIDSANDKQTRTAAMLRKSAEVSPAMGLIGTLIGLVQMLGNLDNPSTIGPAMAVALLTTFYGAVLSYMVFSPLATKVERNTKADILVANIYLQAVRSIARKENPRQLEMVINSILPPGKRVRYFDQKRTAQRAEGASESKE